LNDDLAIIVSQTQLDLLQYRMHTYVVNLIGFPNRIIDRNTVKRDERYQEGQQECV